MNLDHKSIHDKQIFTLEYIMSKIFKRLGFLKLIFTRKPALIIHADETWIEPLVREGFDFFTKLATKARSEGMGVYAVPTKSWASKISRKQKHIHIHLGQRFKLDSDPEISGSVLYAMPSYIWGFWYLDFQGVVYYSSLRNETFYPDAINLEKAKYFYDGVSSYNLEHNRSKFDQADRVKKKIPNADAVLYLQDIEKYKKPVHYLSNVEMIETLAKTCNGLVYVKLHPLHDAIERCDIERITSQYDNVVISDLSIHDLSEASQIVVTHNSAAGFEALMQKKPVITCAKCDFHHATITCKTVAELEAAVRDAECFQKTFPFEKYLYWFLNEHLFESDKPEFITRAWARCLELLKA